MALTKTEIIRTALAILDDYGLTDLTMRRLADNLNVKASALYWHVANKQSLLAELVNQILAGLTMSESGPEPAAQEWRRRLAAWSMELRARLLEHRDSADLVASMRAIGLAGTELSAAPSSVLQATGMDPEHADVAAQTLLYFILGHVDEEQQRAQLGALAKAGPAAEPTGETTGEAAAVSYRAGIGLILDGMAVALPQPGHPDSG